MMRCECYIVLYVLLYRNRIFPFACCVGVFIVRVLCMVCVYICSVAEKGKVKTLLCPLSVERVKMLAQ